MNATIDVETQPARRGFIGRVLQGAFQEWVLHLALIGAIVGALLDGASTLNRGTFV